MTFRETVVASMKRRIAALEDELATCDHVVIVGDPGEASCEALAETAHRLGRVATVVASPHDLDPDALMGQRVGLTAGAFALDEVVRAVAAVLRRK